MNYEQLELPFADMVKEDRDQDCINLAYPTHYQTAEGEPLKQVPRRIDPALLKDNYASHLRLQYPAYYYDVIALYWKNSRGGTMARWDITNGFTILEGKPC